MSYIINVIQRIPVSTTALTALNSALLEVSWSVYEFLRITISIRAMLLDPLTAIECRNHQKSTAVAILKEQHC